MITQHARLFRELERHGWRRLEEGTWVRALEWWAQEVWVLESLWRPAGRRLYLTFVIDPAQGGSGTPRPRVWCVTAAPDGPAQWSDVQLPLGRGWEEGLDPFFAGLDRLRQAHGTDAGPGDPAAGAENP